MAMDMWRARQYGPSAVRHAFDRLFDEAGFSQQAGGGTTGFQSLPVNVWEAGDGYQAALLAPGLDEASINVSVHDDTLAIEGELSVEVPDGAKAIWQEFGSAKFRRSIRLGSGVDPTRVDARHENGILLVTMPKAENAKPRQIQVQLGSGKTQN